MYFISNISCNHLFILLKYFLFCVILEQFRYHKAFCMCDNLLKSWILFVDKLLMLHFIRTWNDSNDKFSLICNEDWYGRLYPKVFRLNKFLITFRHNKTNCVIIMSRTRFRVNPHSVVAWMSRNPLLEAALYWAIECGFTQKRVRDMIITYS